MPHWRHETTEIYSNITTYRTKHLYLTKRTIGGPKKIFAGLRPAFAADLEAHATTITPPPRGAGHEPHGEAPRNAFRRPEINR